MDMLCVTKPNAKHNINRFKKISAAADAGKHTRASNVTKLKISVSWAILFFFFLPDCNVYTVGQKSI